MASERKGLLARLLEDWPAKALSLFAALVLFAFNRNGSLKQEYYSVLVRVEGTERFMPAAEYPATVRVALRGEASELATISASDLDAYIDLAGVAQEGARDFPVRVRLSGPALAADPLEVKVEPSQLNLKLERAVSAVVPIEARFNGLPEAGYERVGHQISPPSAEIRGPRSLVSVVSAVYTEAVDLTGAKEDMSVRANLVPPAPLVVLPNSRAVQVVVSVRQALAQRTFETLPIAARGLRPGLELATELPSALLKVQGAQADVKAYQPGPETFSVDFSGVQRPGTYEFPVALEVPPALSIVDSEPASVQVVLREALGR